MPMHKDVKNMVQIGPEGNALIRGIVSAVGTNSITLSSWGGSWTVNVAADTQMMPKSTSTQLAWIKVGDFVGVNGRINTTQAWTVNARLVRDPDAEQTLIMMQKQMRQHMKEMEGGMRKDIKQIKQNGKEQIEDMREKMQDMRKQMKPGQNGR